MTTILDQSLSGLHPHSLQVQTADTWLQVHVGLNALQNTG